jgi:hypothetical protein
MTDIDTQLTSALGYDTSNMRFSEPVVGTIPDSKPLISYRRINITTKNPDGSEGELIFPTDEVFSFGLSENTNIETGKVNGYVMPLCLHSKTGATPSEKAFTDTIDKVVEKCKIHLIANRDKVEQYDLEMNDLKKLNPIYQKREKGKVVDGSSPTLYAKLIVSKKQDKIVTYFFDKNNEPINALDLLGKYCFATAAIKIESIFIGNKISLQVKLYECEVRMTNTGMRRLLTVRPESQSTVQQSSTSNPLDDDDDAGSIVADFEEPKDGEEDVEEPVKEVPKKVVKKVVKKILKKDA